MAPRPERAPMQRSGSTIMSERPREAARQQYQRPHVLIISDDLSLTDFLGEGLPLAGFWTSIIASGLQALEVFRLRQFDLIVVDAALSNFDAGELIRRLRGVSSRVRANDVRTDAPIVVISDTGEAAADPGLVDETANAPIELDAFAIRLHALFAEWQAVHPGRELADFRSGMRENPF